MLQSRASAPNELIAAARQAINPATLPQPDDGDETSKYIHQVYRAVQTSDLTALQSAAHYLAGRGRGLTPSGDDFLLGLVYGLFMLPYRFQVIREPASAMIVATVKKRSTLISANLVECAAAGEVDERLGAAFQALLHPELPPDAAIRGILGWGSSSGMDATAGMAVIIAGEKN
ncbi:MAG: oxamate carbamoyltransferase subunit AllH family protein [Bellilinea sp.]